MKREKTVLILFLIILAVFLFFFSNQKSNASQDIVREIQIIDQREVAPTEIEEIIQEESIVIFGDEKNELYKDLVSFLEKENYAYTKYLVSDSEFLNKLDSYKKEYGFSSGMSKNFRYYPIIFIKEKAFSGFNSIIQKQIEEELKQ